MWEKDGEAVENSSDTITFTPFNHSDTGSYRCKAGNGSVDVICGWITLTTGKLGTCG